MTGQRLDDLASGQGRNTEHPHASERLAQDIAYTINHSVYCTLTDFLNPPINAATDGYLRWLFPGCGHDHSQGHTHGPECQHPVAPLQEGTRWQRVKDATRHSFSQKRLLEYAKGEFIGDVGAVPVTIAAQQMLPDMMRGLRVVSEPVMRPLFRWGVAREMRGWGKQHGIASNSKEYEQHADELYEYEMAHFPQAMVWTAAAFGLNLSYQMMADKSAMAWEKKLLLKSTSVLSGMLVTAGVVVGARTAAPAAMHDLDTWNARHVVLPATRWVGKAFGVDQEDVAQMAAQHDELAGSSWRERVREGSQEHHQRADTVFER